MSVHAKLLERMRQSLNGWGPDDLRRVYEGHGFTSREGANHTFYSHPKFPQLTASVARHRVLPKGYAAAAIKLIDTAVELEQQEAVSEDESA
jgi:hypothetical protein